MLSKYYIIGEIVEEDGPDCDRCAIMYKTDSLEHAESFIQSFREGLRGFYVERDGQPMNAFQVLVKSSEEVPRGLFAAPVDEDICEVPPPNELYRRKVVCFDFWSGKGLDRCDFNRNMPWNMGVNKYHLDWYGKCMTAAAVILSKMVDPSGEFETDSEALQFGKNLLALGWEIMPSIGWAMDQIFLLTSMDTDDKDPDDTDILLHKGVALRKVEEVYGNR